jgi:tRNA G10  N-methylase Trm11
MPEDICGLDMMEKKLFNTTNLLAALAQQHPEHTVVEVKLLASREPTDFELIDMDEQLATAVTEANEIFVVNMDQKLAKSVTETAKTIMGKIK